MNLKFLKQALITLIPKKSKKTTCDDPETMVKKQLENQSAPGILLRQYKVNANGSNLIMKCNKR